jgi:hypothetical protein
MAEFEYDPSVSPDGKNFYFGRSGNIYELSLKALKIQGLTERRIRNK